MRGIMEKRKTIFDYLSQILMIFGFAMLTMNIFCLVFGDSARNFSTMFALGDQGIPTEIAFQFLCVSALVTGLRFVFFTDTLIKQMPLWLRTICMLTALILVIAVFITAFSWFPVNMWQPWAMFFLCFAISFLCSWLITIIRERHENRRMEEALRKLKGQGDSLHEYGNEKS